MIACDNNDCPIISFHNQLFKDPAYSQREVVLSTVQEV